MRSLRSNAALFLLAGIFLAGRATFAALLEISVRPTFNGEPLVLDSLRYQNAAGETLSVSRLSCLLSGFALERAEGSWLECSNQVAWLDAAQHRDTIRLENIPAGNYRSLRFHLGLDTNANHADPAKFTADHPLNPNLNGLHWNWQGGYIFIALEGIWRDAAGPSSGYSYHFARDPNRTRINLTAQLDLTHDATVHLDFDLAALLNAPRPLSFGRDGTSTHSRTNDPVAAVLAANLPGAFRISHIEFISLASAKAAPVKPLYLPEKFTPYRFKMSAVFPIPDLPRDNPLIEERVALGEKLFHETALSRDGTLSCASCHKADAAFTDPRRFSVGVRGQVGTRNGMPLFNLAWKNSFFWDGRAPSLRAQALMPIQDHTEMDETLTNVVAKLTEAGRAGSSLPVRRSNTDDGAQGVTRPTNDYFSCFTAAFGSPEITAEKISLAIESFVLTLTSYDSKFDRAFRGEVKLTGEEQRGFELFMTEYEPRMGSYGADCFHCHGGALFSDHQFHNNGLNLDDADLGRFKVTKLDADKGKFSTPSLRNVELTAPYMHDGKFSTLDDVVAHYDHGIHRPPTLDPNLAKHPAEGLRLSRQDQDALVAFLKTLTDEKFKQGP